MTCCDSTLLRPQPVEEGGARPSDVQVPGGGGGEAHPRRIGRHGAAAITKAAPEGNRRYNRGMPDEGPLVVATFALPTHAEMARELLERNGIDARLRDQGFIGVHPWLSNAV